MKENFFKKIIFTFILLFTFNINAKIIKMNIKYMQNGYCYVEHNASYHAKSMNFPSFYTPKTNTLELVAFPHKKTIFKKSYSGFNLILANASNKIIKFIASDFRLPLIMQGKIKGERWKDIEFLPFSWCGNSYNEISLIPNQAWIFSVPVYEGNTQVKLRFIMNDIVSNEFDGTINMEQFSILKKDSSDTFDYLYYDYQFKNK